MPPLMRDKIQATVVTGFLGAGKTSLIRHILDNANGRRLALIINEFGDLGIDRELLIGSGAGSGNSADTCADPACPDPVCGEEDILELANGCICCTVADDFLPTITALIERPEPPEHIIIETSGLALPKPLLKAFDWPEVRARVTVDGVVTVLDSLAVHEGRFADDPEAVARQRMEDPGLDHDNPLEEVFSDQIACADLVVLNKTDLLEPDQLKTLLTGLETTMRPMVKTVTAKEGAVDPMVLLGLNAAAEDDVAARPSCHDGEGEHDHDDFDSFTVEIGKITDIEAFLARLEDASARHDILRIKGFAEIPDKPMRLAVQGVGGRFRHYFDRPWKVEEARRGALVVIGAKGLDASAIADIISGPEGD